MCRRTDLTWGGLAVALLWVSVAGCASAPDSWQLEPERVSETACGGWTRVTLENDTEIEGELLAVDASVVYLHDGEALHSIPAGRIQQTKTVYAKTYEGPIGGWMAGGTASTITHGLTLVISAPIWLLSGSAAMGAESGTGRETEAVPARKRARFPQGLPPSFRQTAETLSAARADSTRAPEMAGGCPPSPNDESDDQ